jgi:hypothetical protein
MHKETIMSEAAKKIIDNKNRAEVAQKIVEFIGEANFDSANQGDNSLVIISPPSELKNAIEAVGLNSGLTLNRLVSEDSGKKSLHPISFDMGSSVVVDLSEVDAALSRSQLAVC